MKKPSVPVLILALGFVFVLVLWSWYAFVDFNRPVEKWGLFGDKFGALNCLFTGLAMVGVVGALWHEREQAAARDAEQKEILRRMDAQTEAIRAQAAVTGEAARIEAMNTKINRYREHLDDYGRMRPRTDFSMRMMDELGRAIKQMEDELDRFIGLTPRPPGPTEPQSPPE